MEGDDRLPLPKKQRTLFGVGFTVTKDPKAAFVRPQMAREVLEQQAERMVQQAAAAAQPSAKGPGRLHAPRAVLAAPPLP